MPVRMVCVILDKDERTVVHDGSIKDLIIAFGINPETVIVVKNGEVVTDAESCSGDDEVRLLSVVSGG